MECPPSYWRKHDYDDVEIDETAGEVKFALRGETKRLEEGKYCVGAILDDDRLWASFMDCHTPCGGITPCLR